MKHFHQQFLPAGLLRCFLVIMILQGFFLSSRAQVYTVMLAGANEAPPNASPGTGTAVITINGNFMNVNTSFSGLLGNTTASHIHAPTAVAGTGNAGVATTTPTFTNFPLGVTSGTYNHTFDMTLASSYNPAYLTANGGAPATAFAALKTAMDNGQSYLNIHSTSFPGGEIRGFLHACPTITVNIPDAFALPEGTVANTVYPAYAPASSLTLEAIPNGGAAPYSYTWATGETTASITVSPTTSTTYNVTVHDKYGCPSAGANKNVMVADIAGGKNGDKINLCHKGNKTLVVNKADVADHLGHGDMLGECAAARTITLRKAEVIKMDAGLSVKVVQNPAPNYFDIRINGTAGKTVSIRVYDLMGRAVENKPAVPSNGILRIGTAYSPGTYLVEVVQGAQKQLLKLIKWQ